MVDGSEHTQFFELELLQNSGEAPAKTSHSGDSGSAVVESDKCPAPPVYWKELADENILITDAFGLSPLMKWQVFFSKPLGDPAKSADSERRKCLVWVNFWTLKGVAATVGRNLAGFGILSLAHVPASRHQELFGELRVLPPRVQFKTDLLAAAAA